MARSLVQALEGINFPCNRSSIIEYAKRNDISPRAMDFLERLPDQQYASMGDLFAVLPSKGSLRKSQSRRQDAEAETANAETEVEGEGGDEEQEPEPEPAQVRQAAQDRRNEPASAPSGKEGRDWRQPDLTAMAARMDPFGVANQWQRLWLDWYGKSTENYARLLMPWRRR